jgi:DtxR family Mn-dependent transcriptional regulator
MVAITSAVEDYLKAIYALSSRGEVVTTGLLAHEVGVSSPSVSAMVKRLQSEQLVDRPDGRPLRLTAHGEQAALRVIRRHRLLETLLATMLAVPWDEVHAEAELLEHALSDRLEERIDTALGHPARDPHGDPIPPRHGSHDDSWGQPLDAAPVGCRFRVDRVSDRDSDALRYLGSLGVTPGVVLDVQEQAPFGGPRWVQVHGKRHALGAPLTRLLHGQIITDAPEDAVPATANAPMTGPTTSSARVEQRR